MKHWVLWPFTERHTHKQDKTKTLQCVSYTLFFHFSFLSLRKLKLIYWCRSSNNGLSSHNIGWTKSHSVVTFSWMGETLCESASNAILANMVNSCRTYQPLSEETVMELVASGWLATSKPYLHTHTRTCRKGGQFGFEKEKFFFFLLWNGMSSNPWRGWAHLHINCPYPRGKKYVCGHNMPIILAKSVTQESRSALSVNSHNIAKENIREKTKLKFLNSNFDYYKLIGIEIFNYFTVIKIYIHIYNEQKQ